MCGCKHYSQKLTVEAMQFWCTVGWWSSFGVFGHFHLYYLQRLQCSIDAVSDRDFLLEFLSTNSITAVHLSRLAEEWVLWASEEFGFLIPSDAVSTGSSIMPQKKNPDPMELVRGKSARVIGNLTTLLVLCKGLPQAYNRDLQVMPFFSFLFVPVIEQQLDYFSIYVNLLVHW